ncbi:MAG TPA: type II toxin-antitoxin system VapC family toxin [Vicinamibacterales bacterium]|nr:type II toxin-antitoxin system VapC family toxin [Vicinamibacterales bacterium]
MTRVLLDTHAFLWGIADDPRLSTRARRAIAAAGDRYVSVASCWEMAIKTSLGRLTMPRPMERFLAEQLGVNGCRLLHIDLDDVATVAALPFHHRDPFDRMLVAQALSEELTIVSADSVFEKYGVKRVW